MPRTQSSACWLACDSVVAKPIARSMASGRAKRSYAADRRSRVGRRQLCKAHNSDASGRSGLVVDTGLATRGGCRTNKSRCCPVTIARPGRSGPTSRKAVPQQLTPSFDSIDLRRERAVVTSTQRNAGCRGLRDSHRATQVRSSEGRDYRGRTKRGFSCVTSFPHRPRPPEACLRGRRALASRPEQQRDQRSGWVLLAERRRGAPRVRSDSGRSTAAGSGGVACVVRTA
jgi:hypothetical protein